MKVIGSALGRERNIANLRKFRTVVEGCYLEFRNSFHRWVGIRTCGACKNVDRRDTVNRYAGHVCRNAVQGDVSLTVLLYVGRCRQGGERTARYRPEIERELRELVGRFCVPEHRIFGVHLLHGRTNVEQTESAIRGPG